MKRYILGAGAQGRITAELWRALVPDAELSFLDDNAALHGKAIEGTKVAGPIRILMDDTSTAAEAVIAVGNNLSRLDVADACSATRARWAVLAHPSAVVMPSADIGEGTVILAQGVVNTGAKLGRHVLINTAAIVEHDAVIEDGASLGPGVATGGRIRIGRGAFISTGVTIAPRISIGAGTIVGAGAVVVRDLPEGVLAYGVPARVVRKLEGAGEFRRVL